MSKPTYTEADITALILSCIAEGIAANGLHKAEPRTFSKNVLNAYLCRVKQAHTEELIRALTLYTKSPKRRTENKKLGKPARFCDEQMQRMLEMRKTGTALADIAKEFDADPMVIRRTIRRLDPQANNAAKDAVLRAILPPETIKQAQKWRQEGHYMASIARRIGVSTYHLKKMV